MITGFRLQEAGGNVVVLMEAAAAVDNDPWHTRVGVLLLNFPFFA